MRKYFIDKIKFGIPHPRHSLQMDREEGEDIENQCITEFA